MRRRSNSRKQHLFVHGEDELVSLIGQFAAYRDDGVQTVRCVLQMLDREVLLQSVASVGRANVGRVLETDVQNLQDKQRREREDQRSERDGGRGGADGNGRCSISNAAGSSALPPASNEQDCLISASRGSSGGEESVSACVYVCRKLTSLVSSTCPMEIALNRII